jgi:hypothetical protein
VCKIRAECSKPSPVQAGAAWVESGQTSLCTIDGALSIRRKSASPCRDVPGFVRNVCKRVLHKIIVDRDVEGAVEESKNWIRRLVSGKLSMAEFVMTGGLWRVDDSDISRVAGEKHNLQYQKCLVVIVS